MLNLKCQFWYLPQMASLACVGSQISNPMRRKYGGVWTDMSTARSLLSKCRSPMTKEDNWLIINMSVMPYCHWQPPGSMYLTGLCSKQLMYTSVCIVIIWYYKTMKMKWSFIHYCFRFQLLICRLRNGKSWQVKPTLNMATQGREDAMVVSS